MINGSREIKEMKVSDYGLDLWLPAVFGRDASEVDRRSFLSLSAMLGLAACAPKTVSSLRPKTFDWSVSSPASAGMSQEGIEAVRAAVQQQIDAGIINGAVSAIARRGKLVWYEAQGFSNPLNKAPMRKDAIFRVMSSTKPVTALAVLKLVDEGKLSLDDKVSKYIPSFRNPRVAVAPPGTTDAVKVTIVPAVRELVVRDLLTHTSGITSVGDKLSAPGIAALVNKIERKPDDTLASYVPRLGEAVLEFQPGSKFSYSPTDAHDIALRIVEIVSGQSADVFMQDRLFGPLDMVDTGFNVAPGKQSRIVDIYAKSGESWKTVDHVLGSPPYRYFSGGGGLFSTVHDFMNLEIMLLNRGSFNGRRILRPETHALMTKSQVGDLFATWIPPITKGNAFGLSVRIANSADNVNGRSIGAYGWGGAYGTESWVEPSLDLAAVFFIQMNPPPFSGSLAFEKAARAAIVA